ncbi:MAG: hypothetical protein U0271_39470 [Polyangiaceae bacterium]
MRTGGFVPPDAELVRRRTETMMKSSYELLVRERIKTGVYGYIVEFERERSSDAASGAHSGLRAVDLGTTAEIVIERIDKPTIFRVTPTDSTFEVALPPGSYRVHGTVELIEPAVFYLAEGDVIPIRWGFETPSCGT